MLLEMRGVECYYGSSQVLFGVDLALEQGQAVALLGRNGMGKTTTVRALMGLTPAARGAVLFDGVEITAEPPFRVARRGIGLVPEGRKIFPNLTVRENLVAVARGRGWGLAQVYRLFPRLEERQAHSGAALSGGEQQMLAIGRALMTNPRLLVLDEATEGLAPALRREIWERLERLRSEGLSLLVVDRDARALSHLCDRFVVLEKGQVVWNGSAADWLAEPALAARYLGVDGGC